MEEMRKYWDKNEEVLGEGENAGEEEEMLGTKRKYWRRKKNMEEKGKILEKKRKYWRRKENILGKKRNYWGKRL